MTSRLPRQPHEWIDRTQPLRFRFEGREFGGFAGDTISTALWAAGVRVLGRSFKYHRPRGIFGLADIDCNVLLEDGEQTNIRGDITPLREGMNLRAVNTAGGVERDRLKTLDKFAAFTPVGFYYKAFHRPRGIFPFCERQIRKVAGLGRINPKGGHSPSPKDYDFCDVLVVGAGPAGLSAAAAAASAGAQVLLVDENRRPGGSLWFQYRGDEKWRRLLDELCGDPSASPNLRIRTGTTAVGYYADHWVALVDERRLTKLRAGAVVVASGCYEQPAVFRNNDLPGVMLAGAAQRLIHLYSVKPCSRAVVVAANSEGYRAALDLRQAGVEVAALLDLRREGEPSELSAAARDSGIPLHLGEGVYEALPSSGKRGVRGVSVCPLDGAGRPGSGSSRVLPCDGVILSVGWAPADGLLRQAGTRMEYSEAIHQFVPVDRPSGIYTAGRVNGVYDLERQLEDGLRAGRQAAAQLGFESAESLPAAPEKGPCPNHPYPIFSHPKGKNFLDLDEDLQIKDLENALQEGFDSPELMKRYTAVGMGPSQGKHSNLTALRILSRLQGKGLGGRQMTTARPFVTAVKLGHLAGRIFTADRRTSMHSRHVALGARWMYAGNWLRPEYYAADGLSRQECIVREAGNVRTQVGLIDLGTLGKFEVCGRDAVSFLERAYTGLFTRLKLGMSRYGVICDESGVVVDDGVIARLGEQRFYVSSTTTGSAGVFREFKRWAMEWGMQVTLINCTDQFGAMNLAGPYCRQVLQPLTELDLGPEAFPYLGSRECLVAGVPARVCRVGFVGELGYEIHVPADGAVHVWDSLMERGREFGIRPFGVEAQRTLRLEKAHLIVGQDTDGLTIPSEAGLDWAVKTEKPFFVGQRSLVILQRHELQRQLVGFALPRQFRGPLPKEGHLVIHEAGIDGRVTSVVWSPALEQVIGLGYVHPSRSRPGTRIRIRVDGGVTVDGEVVTTPFYDPESSRQKAAQTGGEAR